MSDLCSDVQKQGLVSIIKEIVEEFKNKPEKRVENISKFLVSKDIYNKSVAELSFFTSVLNKVAKNTKEGSETFTDENKIKFADELKQVITIIKQDFSKDKTLKIEKINVVDTNETGLIFEREQSSVTTEGVINTSSISYTSNDSFTEEAVSIVEHDLSDKKTLIHQITKTRFAGAADLHNELFNKLSSDLFNNLFINFETGDFVDPILGGNKIHRLVETYKNRKTDEVIEFYNKLTEFEGTSLYGNNKVTGEGSLKRIQEALNEANITPRFLKNNPQISEFYKNFVIAHDFDLLINAYEATNSFITRDEKGEYKLLNETTIRDGALIGNSMPNAIKSSTQLLRNLVESIPLSNGNNIHFNTFSRLVSNLPNIKTANYQEEISKTLLEGIKKAGTPIEQEILKKIYDRFYNTENKNSLVNIVKNHPSAQKALTLVNQYITTIKSPDLHSTKKVRDKYKSNSIIAKTSGTQQQIQNSIINNLFEFAETLRLDETKKIERVDKKTLSYVSDKKSHIISKNVKLSESSVNNARKIFTIISGFDLTNKDYDELFSVNTINGRENATGLIESNLSLIALTKAITDVKDTSSLKDGDVHKETLDLLRTFWNKKITPQDVNLLANISNFNSRQAAIDRFAPSTTGANVKIMIGKLARVMDILALNTEKATTTGVTNVQKPKLTLHSTADSLEEKISKFDLLKKGHVNYHNILNSNFNGGITAKNNIVVTRPEGVDLRTEKVENSNLTENDDFFNQIVSDYYGRLSYEGQRDKGDNPIYTPIVYADKGTPRSFSVPQELVTNTNLSFEDQIQETLARHFKQGQGRYTQLSSTIVKDYNKALGLGFTSVQDIDNYLKERFAILQEQYGKDASRELKYELSKQFSKANLELVDNIHIDESKPEFNAQLLAKIKVYTEGNLDDFKTIMKKKAIKDAKYFQYVNLPDSIYSWFSDKEAKVGVTRPEFFTKIKSFNEITPKGDDTESITKVYRVDRNGEEEVNPLFEKFFYEFSLLQDSFSWLLHGDSIQYKGDTLNKKFIEQTKRAGNNISTGHRLQLGLDEGVENTQNIAVVDDLETSWEGFLGQKVDFDKFDGSMIGTTIAARQKANSLGGELGQDAGINFKTVSISMSDRLGVATLRKWLEFTITNEALRNNPKMKEQYKKLLSNTIEGKKLKVQKNYRTYVYDPDTGKVKTVTLTPDSPKNSFDSAYDLWSYLGGEYTLVPDDKGNIEYKGQRYTYADYKTIPVKDLAGNLLVASDIVSEVLGDDKRETVNRNNERTDGLKEKYFKEVVIDGVAMGSGVKTGKANINKVEDFHNPDAKYMTQRVGNRDYILAITLKKSYEQQAGRETVKSTQLIGALSLGGNTPELSSHAYEVLKTVTENSINKKLQKLFKQQEWDQNALKEVLELTQKKLKSDLSKRDSLSLATEIVSESLSKNVNFDAGQITSIITTALNSYLSKDGIKQRVDGGQMVIVPPITPLYEVVDSKGNRSRMMYETAKRLKLKDSKLNIIETQQDLKSADTLVNIDIINEFFGLPEDLVNYYSRDDIMNSNGLVSIYDLHTTAELFEINKKKKDFKKQGLTEELKQLEARERKLNRENEKFSRFLESQKDTLSNYEAFRNSKLLYKIIPGEVLMAPVHASKFGLRKGQQPQEVTIETMLEKAKEIHEKGKLGQFIKRTVEKVEAVADADLDLINVYNSIDQRVNTLTSMSQEEWDNRTDGNFNTKEEELKAAKNNLDKLNKFIELRPDSDEKLESIMLKEIADGEEGNRNSLVYLYRNAERLLKKSREYLDRNKSKLKKEIIKAQGSYDNYVQQTAEELYANFKLSNRVTNMRIPLQSFASVMHNNVIGYLWDMNNAIMINDKHQALTGGDFDADKSNSELLSFSSNGQLIKWKQDMDSKNESTWMTTIEQLEKDLQENKVTTKGALNYLTYLTSVMASSPANLNPRETEISMDNTKKVANSTSKGQAAAQLITNSIASTVRIRNANMVAADAIGIFATAIKALSVIHNANHKALAEINELSAQLKSGNLLSNEQEKLERRRDYLKSIISFNHRFDGRDYKLVGSLNFDYISEKTVNSLLDSVYEISDKLLPEQDSSIYIDKVKTLLEEQVKNYDQLGQLLNAAVDNAKELLLNKMNADAQTSSIFGVGITIGIPLQDLADTLTNKVIEYNLNKSKKSPFGGAYKSFRKLLSENSLANQKDSIVSDTIRLIDAGQEFKILGQTLGVNSGLPTDSYGMYNYKKRLEDFINLRLSEIKDEEVKNRSKSFRLEKFINALYYENDPEYIENVISSYDAAKSVNNIPWLISENPHYVQQLKLLIDASTWHKAVSYKAKNIDQLINTFNAFELFNTNNINDGKFKSIIRMMDEMTISSYYNEIPFKYPVEFTVNRKDGTKHIINEIDLSSVQGREDYINWMHTLIPLLKKNIPSNTFLSNLIYGLSKRDNFGQQFMQYKMVYNPLEQKTDNQKLKVEKAREDFNSLGDFTIGDNTYDLQELFTHYNRIINKEQITANSLSNIIHDNKHVKAFWLYQANKRDSFDLSEYIGEPNNPNLDVLMYLTAEYGLAEYKTSYPIHIRFSDKGDKKIYSREEKSFVEKAGKIYDFKNTSDNLLYPDRKTKPEQVQEEETTDTDFEIVDPLALPASTQPSTVNIDISKDRYTRKSVTNDNDTMYLFTDNAERTSRPKSVYPNITEGWYAEKYKDKTNKPLHFGSTSNPTSAVIRGLNNAYPISTMSAYGTNWTNSNFDLFKQTIDDEINQIKQDLPKFSKLRIGNYRIGQGGLKAKLPSKHQSYLDQKLLGLGIDNSKSVPTRSAQPQQSIENSIDLNKKRFEILEQLRSLQGNDITVENLVESVERLNAKPENITKILEELGVDEEMIGEVFNKLCKK